MDRRPLIVLLRNGRMIKGLVSEEDGVYLVTQPIGVMRFPKSQVEKVFTSIQNIYAYKLEQLPEEDFDRAHQAGPLVSGTKAGARGETATRCDPEAQSQPWPGQSHACIS